MKPGSNFVPSNMTMVEIKKFHADSHLVRSYLYSGKYSGKVINTPFIVWQSEHLRGGTEML